MTDCGHFETARHALEHGSGGIDRRAAERWPYLWTPCMAPERNLDVACVFGDCSVCQAAWDRWGCPVTEIPPLPEGAPIYREPINVPPSVIYA